jgi:hypothetical protein
MVSPDRRRALLILGARTASLAGAWFALGAHTPYQRWKVYRQRHLLIVASKTDPEAFRLSKAIAAILAADLPESQARASRAPNLVRIASLLGTAQMDVAVLARADAAALNEGTGPFAESGAVALRTLFVIDAHLLVSRADFPQEHGFLIAEALHLNRGELPGAVPDEGTAPVPAHTGALDYQRKRDKAD